MSALLPIEETIELVRMFEHPKFKLAPLFPQLGMLGQTARWTVFPDAQTKADFVAFADPARFVSRAGMYEKALVMAHMREKIPIQATRKFDRRPGSAVANEPWSLEDQVADELARMSRRFERSKEYLRGALLVGGVATLYFPLTNHYQSIDFGTSIATHMLSVATPWTYTDANIMATVETMAYTVEVDAGTELKKIIGGPGLWLNMTRNADLKGFMQYHPEGLQALQRGELPTINGIEFEEVRGGYKNSAGTFVNYIHSNFVVGLAEPSEIGLRMLQGESIEVEAQGNPGVFAKTWIEQDPSGQVALMDEVCMPVVEVPTGIITATGIKS